MRHIAEAGKVDWCTPKWVIDLCVEVMGPIDLDPCSNANSLVGAKTNFILPEQDGLRELWDAKTVFVNPPYGRVYMAPKTKQICTPKEYRDLGKPEGWLSSTVADWVYKAACERDVFNYDLCLLIPAAVETRHWQKCIFKEADAICFFERRVKFIGGGDSPPMPTAMIYFGDKPELFLKVFSKVGFTFRSFWHP